MPPREGPPRCRRQRGRNPALIACGPGPRRGGGRTGSRGGDAGGAASSCLLPPLPAAPRPHPQPPHRPAPALASAASAKAPRAAGWGEGAGGGGWGGWGVEWTESRPRTRGWATCVTSPNLRRGSGRVGGHGWPWGQNFVQLAWPHETPAGPGPGELESGRVPGDPNRGHSRDGWGAPGSGASRGRQAQTGGHGTAPHFLDVCVRLISGLRSGSGGFPTTSFLALLRSPPPKL